MGSRQSRRVLDVSNQPLIPYARNSKPSKKKGKKFYSVDTQNIFIRDYCMEEEIPLYEGPTITDKDLGAAFDAKERPGWAKVWRMIQTLEYGGIAVMDADRAARDGWIGEQLIKLVRDNHLKGFRVVSPIVTYDLSTQEGADDFREALRDAEKEVRKIRKRTTIALRHRAMMGQPTSGQRRVFGWLDKPLNIQDPGEADEILRACLWIDSEPEFRMRDLVDDWQARGIVSTHGLPFTHDQLKKILVRPSNAGIITASGGERGRLPGDPIVGEALFRRVVAHFEAANRGRPPSRKYLVSGLNILRCSDCKSRMRGGKVNRHEKPSYQCTYNPNRPKRKGCKRSIQMCGVDEFVKEHTLAWWKDPVRATRDHLYILQTTPEERRIRAQIDMVDERLVSLATKLDLPPERYEYAVLVLKEHREGLADQLAEIQTPAVREKVTAEQVDDLWNHSLESRRMMIKAAIREVRVHRHIRPKGALMAFDPGRLEVTFW